MQGIFMLLGLLVGLVACSDAGTAVNSVQNTLAATMTARVETTRTALASPSGATTRTPPPGASRTPRPRSTPTSTPDALVWDAIRDYQDVGVPLPKSARLFGGGIYVPDDAYQDIQTAVFGDEMVLGVGAYFPNDYEGETAVQQADGTDIEKVEFTVAGPDGSPVYQYADDTPPYCLFGDSDGACIVHVFSENNCRWPDTDETLGAFIQPGFHDFNLTLFGPDDQNETWFATLDIQDTGCTSTTTFDAQVDVSGCCNDEGQRNDDVLSDYISITTAGYLALQIQTTDDACSDVRYFLYVDEEEVAVTDFVGPVVESTGTDYIELGNYAEGEHTIRISPEGEEGGCNTGVLGGWSGLATVYYTQ